MAKFVVWELLPHLLCMRLQGAGVSISTYSNYLSAMTSPFNVLTMPWQALADQFALLPAHVAHVAILMSTNIAVLILWRTPHVLRVAGVAQGLAGSCVEEGECKGCFK